MSNFPDHIQYIIDTHAEGLNQARERENLIMLSNQDILETFMQADPTRGKKLVDWLVTAWTQKDAYPGFLWEDVRAGATSRVADTLKAFALNFKKLRVEDRNIYKYSSIGDIWKTIKPLIPPSQNTIEVSGAEVKRKLKARAIEESLIVHRSESLIISIPLTEAASCWWGKGTQWCTAAREYNMFKEYSKKSPLIIFTLPKGLKTSEGYDAVACKFQLHLESGQFMDENDRNLSISFIDENWSVFGPIIEFAAQHNHNFHNFVPLSRLREETFYIKVKLSSVFPENSETLMKSEHFKSLLSPRVIDLLVENNKCSVVPPKLFTSEQIARALQINPYYINHFETRVTSEQAKELVSVEGKGGVLMWFEPDIVTPEIIRLAADNGADITSVYHEEWLDRDTIKYFLRTDGFNIRFLSEEQKQDVELIWLAVEQNGRALSYIDKDLWTEELILAAIRSNPDILMNLSKNSDFLTPKVLELAEEYSLKALRYLPKNFITQSIAEKAIRENGNYFDCLPDQFKNKHFALLAIENCKGKNNVNLSNIYNHISDMIFSHVSDREVVLAYVNKFPANAITLIPKELRDEEICTLAVEKYPRNISSYSLKEMHPELYSKLAIKASIADPSVICSLDNPDQDLFREVLSANPSAADKISDQKLTEMGITPPNFKLEWDENLLKELQLFFEKDDLQSAPVPAL